jgi:hypothetical protein
MFESTQNGYHYLVDSILGGKGSSVWRWTVRSDGSEGRIVASRRGLSAL